MDNLSKTMINILETKIIEFKEKKRKYLVVDRNMGLPAPKYFIAYAAGVQFISNEIPEDYRNPMVFHKLTEFELLPNENNKCLKSLLAELETIPENKRKEYLEFRREAFESLIDFLEQYEPDSSSIPEARNSLKYLKNN